jgi:hypothetical protein
VDDPAEPVIAPAAGDVGEAVDFQLVPADAVVEPGGSIEYDARAVDAAGRVIGPAGPASWSLAGLQGTLQAGRFTAETGLDHAGTVNLGQGGGGDGHGATARVRVLTRGSWSQDFEAAGALTVDAKPPGHWIGSLGRFVVRRHEGGNVLVKHLAPSGLQRSNVYVGPADLSGYTIQVDAMGTVHRRNRSDMGLIAQRYTFDMMGNHQQLQVRSWASDLRMAVSVPFAWDTDVWYTMKMRVDVETDRAIVLGKAWRRGEPEPETWSIEAEDPLPNRQGAPGIYGYSAAPIYYDNLRLEIDD